MKKTSPGEPAQADNQEDDGWTFPTGWALAVPVRKRELGHGRIIPEARSQNDK
jgi:hypothetical protein